MRTASYVALGALIVAGLTLLTRGGPDAASPPATTLDIGALHSTTDIKALPDGNIEHLSEH